MGEPSDAVNTLLQFFTELSWRRLRACLFLAIICVVIFFAYDRYTSSFTFARLERAADLIASLQKIESAGKLSPELQQIYERLRSQVDEAVNKQPITVDRPPKDYSNKFWIKGIFGMSPWILLSFIMIPAMRRGEENAVSGFVAIYLLGFLSGAVGLVIPAFWWPWGNVIIYPLSPILIFVIIAVIFSLKKKKS